MGCCYNTQQPRNAQNKFEYQFNPKNLTPQVSQICFRFSSTPETIQQIILKNVTLNTADTIILGKIVNNLPNLRQINFTNNRLDSLGVKNIFRDLINCSIMTIRINDNIIQDLGAAILSDCLRDLPNLRTLQLRGNGISDKAASDVAFGIKQHPSIQALHVQHNNLTKGGIKVLANSVKLKEYQCDQFPLSSRDIEKIQKKIPIIVFH